MKWDLQACKKDAKRFPTRVEWKNNSTSAYQTAWRSGWLDICCKHMEMLRLPKGSWNLEACKKDALKFDRRIDWQKNANVGYQAAVRNGWVDICCGHMPIHTTLPRGTWTFQACKKDAKRFKTRIEWFRGSRSAYSIASKNRWLNYCCRHMAKLKTLPKGTWGTLEACKKDALKFEMRNPWRLKSSGAYYSAHRHGWLEECCKHMKARR